MSQRWRQALPFVGGFVAVLVVTLGIAGAGVADTGLTVQGNLTCANKQIVATTVTGNLTVQAGGWCDLVDVTVKGNLQATGSTGLRVFHGAVGGNLGATGTTAALDPWSNGVNQICGTTVKGNLQVTGSAASAPWEIGGPAPWGVGGCDPNVVSGNFQFVGNAAPGNQVSDNSVQGNLQCTGTQPSGATNLVTGNAQGCGATKTIVYAAPTGSGTACSKTRPCALPDAQQFVRKLLGPDSKGKTKPLTEDVVVQLADGTYRLSAPLTFDASDSGRDGHVVVWEAAPNAHPVLSGALQVTGWQQVDQAKNIWEAPVPDTLETRQLYVDGKWAPIAQTTPAEQGITAWAANGVVGQTTTPATWGPNLRAQIGAANLARVEMVWTAGNGPWTQPRCRIDSLGTGGQIVYKQPCWRHVTTRPVFTMPSGGLPNMSRTRAPNRIENAYPFLHAGQWYLDLERHVLDYIPLPGQDMAAIDVEAPRLTALVTGAGTLDAPVHDITFAGLRFSEATWLDPSGPAGFAEVQDNLRLTSEDTVTPQFVCTFGTPNPGTCPFGNLTREPANVQWSGAHNVTFLGNTFANLGAAGLGLDYGSQHNLVEGNVFSGISGVGIQLGDTLDPHPSDVGADDRELNTHNTIQNNVIRNVGVDYPSAAGITLFFTQHTRVVHNNLYDLPYTAISAGVVQGHVDNSAHPENTTNINSDNTISNNLFHNFMSVLQDGGGIYIEGHQAMTKYLKPDGTLDLEQTIAHGVRAEGNVAYGSPNNNFVWYDDAGAEWVNWVGNVEWQNAGSGQGGCEPTGYIWFTGNWSAERTGNYACSPLPLAATLFPSNNTVLPLSPGAADLPLGVLANAGVTGRFQNLETTSPPRIFYARGSSGGDVFVAGNGFGADTTVSFSGTPATSVHVLNPWFLVATAPAGASTSQVAVSTSHGTGSISGPSVTSVTPASRGQNTAAQTVSITGSGFVGGPGLAASFSGTGITVNSTTFVNSTQVNASVTVAAGATLGARDVTVTSSNGLSATCGGCFTVNAGPTIASAVPSSVSRAGGGTRTVELVGTGFVATPAAAFSSNNGITNVVVTWNSATSVTVSFTIATSATIASRTLTITNPDGGRATVAVAVTA